MSVQFVINKSPFCIVSYFKVSLKYTNVLLFVFTDSDELAARLFGPEHIKIIFRFVSRTATAIVQFVIIHTCSGECFFF